MNFIVTFLSDLFFISLNNSVSRHSYCKYRYGTVVNNTLTSGSALFKVALQHLLIQTENGHKALQKIVGIWHSFSRSHLNTSQTYYRLNHLAV